MRYILAASLFLFLLISCSGNVKLDNNDKAHELLINNFKQGKNNIDPEQYLFLQNIIAGTWKSTNGKIIYLKEDGTALTVYYNSNIVFPEKIKQIITGSWTIQENKLNISFNRMYESATYTIVSYEYSDTEDYSSYSLNLYLDPNLTWDSNNVLYKDTTGQYKNLFE